MFYLVRAKTHFDFRFDSETAVIEMNIAFKLQVYIKCFRSYSIFFYSNNRLVYWSLNINRYLKNVSLLIWWSFL